MSKNLKLVKRIASIATVVCVVAAMMVSASAYGITEPTGGFVYDGSATSVTVPVTGTSSSGQVTIVVRTEGDAWLTDPNANVIFIDQVTGAEGSTSITFGIDNKWLAEDKKGEYKIYVGGSSQAVTSASLWIDADGPVVPTLVSIAVAADAKTAYNVGDAFVAPTVTATYDDGSTKTVAATFSGYDMATAGTQTVTATFEGQTATYEIVVSTVTDPGEGDGDVVLEVVYEEAHDEEDKAVIEATLKSGNGTKKVTVGGAELYWSVQRECYVGMIDAANISGNSLTGAVVTAEAPTVVVYGNIDGDYDYDDIDEAVDSSDLQALKRALKGQKTLAGADLIAADLDGDGLSDSSDLQALKQFLKSGKIFGILK